MKSTIELLQQARDKIEAAAHECAIESEDRIDLEDMAAELGEILFRLEQKED